ncbi:MAG: clostripain-related cysteine peptidase [Firmicutes bacterium]|nr:clostripain-related cysteine peptidase [Bacillota bacterium]
MNIDRTDFTPIRIPVMYKENASAPITTASEQTSLNISDQVSLGIGNEVNTKQPTPSLNQPQASGSGTPAGEAGKDSNPSPTSPPLRKWTILVYAAADNDLEKYIIKDVNDMENVGSSNNMNLVVQIDRGQKPSELSGGWAGARRYKLETNVDPYNLDSPVLQDMGQINMGDPKTLQNFVEWGVKEYPAQHYMLVISDHGMGWKGAVEDDSHNGWLSMPATREALEKAKDNTGVKLDIIGYDACLMGQSEVAYELKDVANYMVASPDSEGAEGWPYNNMLDKNILKNLNMALMAKFSLDPPALAKFIVRAASQDQNNLPTMSAIELDKMDNVAKASNKLVEAVLASDTPPALLKTLVRKTQPFEGFKDHYDFCSRIVTSEDVKDVKLKEAAQGVMDSLYNAVMYEEHSSKSPGGHGLSVHLPSYRATYQDEYRQTQWAKDTKWDKMIDKLD